jgi:hypothetical protein
MIEPGDIQEELDKKPFLPFRIRMTDGSSHEVTDARLVALTERTVFLVHPKEPWKSLSYDGIIYLEGLKDD